MRYYLGVPFQYNVSSGLKLENANKLFIKKKKHTLIHVGLHLYGILFFIQKKINDLYTKLFVYWIQTTT